MEELRKIPFWGASICILLVVLMEIGANLAIGTNNSTPPGYGISFLGFIDGLVLLTIFLIAAPLIIPESIHGRIQGFITLIVSLLVLMAVIAMIFVVLAKLLLMVGLLLAPIFGTIAYFALFASFDTGASRIALSSIMFLKLLFAGLLVFAHQKFLLNKGLLFIILTSFLANFIVSLLHGIVPGFLVSITDAIAAIVLGIIAIIWAIFFIIGSIPAIVKAVR